MSSRAVPLKTFTILQPQPLSLRGDLFGPNNSCLRSDGDSTLQFSASFLLKDHTESKPERISTLSYSQFWTVLSTIRRYFHLLPGFPSYLHTWPFRTIVFLPLIDILVILIHSSAASDTGYPIGWWSVLRSQNVSSFIPVTHCSQANPWVCLLWANVENCVAHRGVETSFFRWHFATGKTDKVSGADEIRFWKIAGSLLMSDSSPRCGR